MHSITAWKFSQRPNYAKNQDLQYPYSEVPYIGQYHLVKIPTENSLIHHVDYWGEGLIETELGTSGFANSYCINHEYQLVSNGPDRDSKIPNRIPVISYTKCDTSSFIKDNSVEVVTLMGAPINKSCAKDVTRIVNADHGKVIIYGFEETSADVTNLDSELIIKGLIFCYKYDLPDTFQGLTLFDKYRAYINVTAIKQELYNSVKKSDYQKAVEITTRLNKSGDGSLIVEVLEKLLENKVNSVMDFAYKLWETKSEEIIKDYFPISFRLILNEEAVKIINKVTMKELKLNDNNQWKITPHWENDSLYFTIQNMGLEMYLGLGNEEVINHGDKKAYGMKNFNKETYLKWFIQPIKKDDDLYFVILNVEYAQALKYEVESEALGEKPTHSEDEIMDNLKWFIAPL